MQLWRKAAHDIWISGLPLGRKLELILCYFGLRKVATHWVSLGFFCTLVPLSVFTPEVSWAAARPPTPCLQRLAWGLDHLTKPGRAAPLLSTLAAQAALRAPRCEDAETSCCRSDAPEAVRPSPAAVAPSTAPALDHSSAGAEARPLQVNIPLWALVHLPVVVTLTTAMFTPKGWLHCILYVLFENAMGIVKLGAVVAGEALLALLTRCLPARSPAGLQLETPVGAA